jgi:hypothetical protein
MAEEREKKILETLLKLVVGILLWAASAPFCDAQLFRRANPQVRWSNSTPARNGHWGYPGRIEDHLASVHGQNVAGLSHEQLLDLHDAIHEGRSIPQRQMPVQPKPIPKQPAIPLRCPAPIKRESLYPSV